MQHVLVTGASRGIGLEFARHYLDRGAQVFAGYRRPETAGKLFDLTESHPERLVLVPLDVSDEASIRASRNRVGESSKSLDLLINNAGIGGFSSLTGKQEQLGSFQFDDSWVVLRTMAVGPLLIAQEYLDLLKAGENAQIANVTSGYGSISSNTSRFPYYYSAAKSALHQLMRSLAADVRPMGISVVLLDPGSVQTDMGGPTAPLTPHESVAGMISVIESLTLAQSGSFISWQGRTMPW
ncbi:MAG TPA: SDR family oxidoreductase [Capsulimonadaceae bacterium]|nr:SDR family oxidoreductase [Capsulimonadaceae bacterium]